MKWKPTPVFLPGESQGWGSLVGCHLWGRIESIWTRLKQLSSSSSSSALGLNVSCNVFLFLTAPLYLYVIFLSPHLPSTHLLFTIVTKKKLIKL